MERSRLQHRLQWGFILGAFVFVLSKAALAPFTHDESFSFNASVPHHWMELLSFADHFSNNHILNSLGMKATYLLFGPHALSLRLPNVLAFLIMAWSLFQLIRNWHAPLAWAALLALAGNEYLLHFFAMARGYGLSIAFMLLALHFWVKAVTTKRSWIWAFHGASLLACLSSFTMLQFYLCALVADSLWFGLRYRAYPEMRARNWFMPLFLGLIPVVVVMYEPVRQLLKYNALDFGGQRGFWNDTLHALTYVFKYHLNWSDTAIEAWTAFMVLMCGIQGMYVLRCLWKKTFQKLLDHPVWLLSLLLFVGISLSSVLQHYILGTSYLIGRFAAFLFPLWILSTLGFFQIVAQEFRVFRLASPIIPILLCVQIALVIPRVNFRVFDEWEYDRNTSEALQAALHIHHATRTNNAPIRLGAHWLFEPSLNYYRQAFGMAHQVLPVLRDDLRDVDRYDFVYLRDEDQMLLDTACYASVGAFDNTHTQLWMRKP